MKISQSFLYCRANPLRTPPLLLLFRLSSRGKDVFRGEAERGCGDCGDGQAVNEQGAEIFSLLFVITILYNRCEDL